jgi:(2Fe-2S) ferredoxin
MSKFQRHFFVCTNEREANGKPSCGQRGGTQVLQTLQRALFGHPELCPTVAVTASGCLGICFDGPAAVVYPQGVWYGELTPSDAQEVADSHLVADVPVERLRYPW